jgi:hypothetical protein
MTETARPRPFKEAARITLMLDHTKGADRFDRAPVDVLELALEYSHATAPQTPIHEVSRRRLRAVQEHSSTAKANPGSGEFSTMRSNRRAGSPSPSGTSSATGSFTEC